MSIGTGEAAKVLGVCKTHLIALVRAGKVRATDIGSAERPVFRFERADLEAFRASRVINPDKGAA